MGLSGVGGGSSFSNFEAFAKLLEDNPEVVFDKATGMYSVAGEEVPEQAVQAAMPHLTLNQGDVFDKEGRPLGTASGAATQFGEGRPVPLPDVQGTGASPNALGGKMQALEELPLASLMFLALFEMARGSSRDQAEATSFRHAMQEQKDKAKDAALEATDKQIAADKAAAQEQFITACIVAVVVAVIQIVANLVGAGGAVQGVSQGVSTAANIAAAAAMPLGQMATTAVDLNSKSRGNQAMANKMELTTKAQELQEAEFDALVDSAKQSAESAKEQFKLALDIIMKTVELQTAAIQKLTS